MTQTRTFARTVLLGLLLASFGAIAVLASAGHGQPAAVDTAPAIEMHRIDAIPAFQLDEVTALAPATDLTPAQVTEMNLVADRICEGITAGVPLMNMADSLVWNQGLTDTEAHDFVRAVAQTHCR